MRILTYRLLFTWPRSFLKLMDSICLILTLGLWSLWLEFKFGYSKHMRWAQDLSLKLWGIKYPFADDLSEINVEEDPW